MKPLLLLVLLSGCAPIVTEGEACTSGHVACSYRVRPGVFEARCWAMCSRGVWVVAQCLPACGPGTLAIGEEGTECSLPPRACGPAGSEGS